MAVIAMTVILFLLHRIMGLREVTYLMALFAGWIIVAIAFAIGIALVASPRVSRMVCDIPTPHMGDKIRVSVEIETRLPWTTFIRVLWVMGRRSVRYSTNHHLSGRRGLIAIPIKAYRRGILEISIDYIYWSDPFSLFTFRRRLHGTTSVLILPTPLNPGQEARPAAAPRSRSIPIDEGEAAGAIREYRNGDAPRSIHWKQSARQGRLLVNVPEVPAPQVATLLLDTRESSWVINSDEVGVSAGKIGPAIDWAAFERAIRVCAFYIQEWLENGDDVELHMGDRVFDSSEVSGDALICELAQVVIESREEYQNWRPNDGERLSTLVGSPKSAELCEYLAPEGAFICSDMGDSGAGVVTPSGWSVIRVGATTGASGGSHSGSVRSGGVDWVSPGDPAYGEGSALVDSDNGQENYGYDAYDTDLEASGPLVAVPGSRPHFYLYERRFRWESAEPLEPRDADSVLPGQSVAESPRYLPASPPPAQPRHSHYGATYSPSSTAPPDVRHFFGGSYRADVPRAAENPDRHAGVNFLGATQSPGAGYPRGSGYPPGSANPPHFGGGGSGA